MSISIFWSQLLKCCQLTHFIHEWSIQLCILYLWQYKKNCRWKLEEKISMTSSITKCKLSGNLKFLYNRFPLFYRTSQTGMYIIYILYACFVNSFILKLCKIISNSESTSHMWAMLLNDMYAQCPPMQLILKVNFHFQTTLKASLAFTKNSLLIHT